MKRIYFLVLAAALLSFQALPAQEWANFSRYKDANSQVTMKPKAVLMGDSITDGWLSSHPGFFTDNNFLGRGISGQCSAQMLVRFRRDVVDNKPKYVVILAGINDIALNDGWSSVENTFGNIVSMCEIAKANKIKPVLCTLLPSDHAAWRPEVTDVAEKVSRINKMITDYAKSHHCKLVDYATLMSDENGVTRADLSSDSIHPNADGYTMMENYLLTILK